MIKKIREELENLTTDDYALLLSFADMKLNILYRSAKVPGGENAEDFVQKVLRKVLDGTRKWDPEKNPDFINFLKGSISSEISNHHNKLISELSFDVDIDSELDFWNNIYSQDNIEERLQADELKDYLLTKLEKSDDELDLGLLFLYEYDGYETEEIRDMLELDRVKDVYNARKRLKRKCQKLIASFYNEEER